MIPKRNEPLEIAAAIISWIYAAAYVYSAVFLIIELISFDKSSQNAGVLFLILLPIELLLIIIVAAISLFSVYCVIAAILPLCLRKPSALRVLAIINSAILAPVALVECTHILRIIVNLYRYGNYDDPLLTVILAVLTLACFSLNVARAVIYKKRKQN